MNIAQPACRLLAYSHTKVPVTQWSTSRHHNGHVNRFCRQEEAMCYLEKVKEKSQSDELMSEEVSIEAIIV